MKISLLAVGMTSIMLMGSVCRAESVTLEQFLDVVRTNHPLFRKEAISRELSGVELEKSLGARDWRIQSKLSTEHSEPPVLSLMTPEQADYTAFHTSLDKPMWSTGGRLSVAADYQYSDLKYAELPDFGWDLSTFTGPTRSHQPKLTLSYSQPLLRNRGGTLDRLAADLQRFNIDITSLQSYENQESFLLQAADRFLQWVLATEQVRISQNRFKLANEHLTQLQEKRKMNIVEEVDLLRGQNEVLSVQADLNQAQADCNGLQAELAILAGDDSLLTSQPAFDVYNPGTVPALQQPVAQILSESRIITALRMAEEQAAVQVKGVRNAARPQLDVVLSASVYDADEQFGDALGTDSQDITAGVVYTYPLGNRSASQELKKARLTLKQIVAERESQTVSLESNLRGLLLRMEETAKTIEIRKKQAENARKRTEEERKSYDQGRTDLTYVIQSRTAEELSALQWVSTSVQYHRLVLQYLALTDRLLPGDTGK